MRSILTQEPREAGDFRNYSGDANCITEQRALSSLRAISRILDLTFQLIAVKPNRARWTLRLRLEDGDLRRSGSSCPPEALVQPRDLNPRSDIRALDSRRGLLRMLSRHAKWKRASRGTRESARRSDRQRATVRGGRSPRRQSQLRPLSAPETA